METSQIKCPHCTEPGNQSLVFVAGYCDGKRVDWQEWLYCDTCGGTGFITPERMKLIEDGERMHQERVARRESLRDMAKRLGVDYCRLSRVEAGMEKL